MHVELLIHIKAVFNEGYAVHSRVNSVVPDALPDRLKIAWFATKQRWFVSQGRDEIPVLDHTNKDTQTKSTKNVPHECTNVESRGKSFIKKNFAEIIHRLFPHEYMAYST